MKNYTVKKYHTSDYPQWNAFINEAKNATFLFHRDFMEYHSDRFSDFSMLVFEDEKLISVIPGNRIGATVFSHQGLSYGGLVFDKNIRLGQVLKVFSAVLSFLEQQQITHFQLKQLPFFYAEYVSDEIQYALFLTEAKLIRRDTLSLIDLSKPFEYSRSKKAKIKLAAASGFTIVEEAGFTEFWNQVLIPNLQQKHGVLPVHTIEEITLLKERFPKNIRQFNVYQNRILVAGTTIFETETVAHAQYISGHLEQNKLGSIDFLYDFLLKNVYKTKQYFDFGTSNENAGRNLNEGLLYWKESFGSKIAVQDFYEVQTSHFTKLQNI